MVGRPRMSSMWKTVRLPHEAAFDSPTSVPAGTFPSRKVYQLKWRHAALYTWEHSSSKEFSRSPTAECGHANPHFPMMFTRTFNVHTHKCTKNSPP